MDIIAHKALIKSAKDLQRYCRGLVERATAVAPYLDSERHSFWDALFLAKFYEESLITLLPMIETTRVTLPWTTRLCSSVIDDAVPGRGLLAQTLFLAIEAGLVANLSDALGFHRCLYEALKNEPEDCLVAYLDYVGAGKDFDWLEFQPVWNSMHAEAVSLGMVGYYWRSSDSFYFARSVTGMKTEDQQETCGAFLDFLLNIQTHYCLNGQEWMWSIGVGLEKGSLVGDIFLPAKGGPVASAAMKEAFNKLRGGGLILVDELFLNALPEDKQNCFSKHATSKKDFYFYDYLKNPR